MKTWVIDVDIKPQRPNPSIRPPCVASRDDTPVKPEDPNEQTWSPYRTKAISESVISQR